MQARRYASVRITLPSCSSNAHGVSRVSRMPALEDKPSSRGGVVCDSRQIRWYHGQYAVRPNDFRTDGFFYCQGRVADAIPLLRVGFRPICVKMLVNPQRVHSAFALLDRKPFPQTFFLVAELSLPLCPVVNKIPKGVVIL